jgi:hypothetical protein
MFASSCFGLFLLFHDQAEVLDGEVLGLAQANHRPSPSRHPLGSLVPRLTFEAPPLQKK